MRLDNPATKKFIVDVNGCLDFIKAVGFEEVEEGGKKYLQIVGLERIDRAIELLVEKLANLQDETKATPDTPSKRVKCLGECGFFGDEKTEGYCSKCHRIKYFGGKPDTPASTVAANGRCVKGCGNFGSEARKGMCNSCWAKEPKPKVTTWKPKFKRVCTVIKAVTAFKSAPRLLQKNKKKCWQCKKKFGTPGNRTLGMECRCGFLFCQKHRYPDEHNCSFNHKAHYQKKLRHENQQILKNNRNNMDRDD